MDDIIGWHYNPKGVFSVKSAYKVHRAGVIRGQRRHMASGAKSSYGMLTVHQKIKHFLWRLGHNTLAVRRNMQQRGMKIGTLCCMCGHLDEDGGHLFLKCKEVKAVWRELNLE